MYKYVPTLALVVGLMVIGFLGAQSASTPEPSAAVGTTASPTPPAAPPTPSPTKAPPVAGARLLPKRITRFNRPPPEVAEPKSLFEPPPRYAVDLDELSPARREAVHANALEKLDELIEACQSTVDGSAKVMASVLLDDQGLYALELKGWESGDDQTLQAVEAPPPQALTACLEDHLWSGGWSQMEADEELSFVLSMRFEPDDE
jgi:hypothetical protein